MTGALRKELFYGMLRVRLVEEAIAEHYTEQQMRCPVHLSIGQEGVASGVCAALKRSDVAMSTHRGHAHYLAKGGALKPMLAEIYGKAAGCCGGKGGSMHLVDLDAGFWGATPIVGNSMPVAVGTAFAASLQKLSRVSAVFFGDGTTEEGVFSECLNFAALKKLPIVFVCENNLYSVYSPLGVRQPKGRDGVAIAKAHGVAAAYADGNDVEAVYKAATAAVDRARRGGGPTYLEFPTYRWREHCGPHYDNDIGYRTPAEFEAWRKLCPLERQTKALVRAKVLTGKDVEKKREAYAAEIAAAFAFAKAAPMPDPKTLLEGLYA